MAVAEGSSGNGNGSGSGKRQWQWRRPVETSAHTILLAPLTDDDLPQLPPIEALGRPRLEKGGGGGEGEEIG